MSLQRRHFLATGLCLLPASGARAQTPVRPGTPDAAAGERIVERFPPPDGYALSPATGFAAWLGQLPLRRAGEAAMLHDGRRRADQSGVAAVLDIDVGSADLQQCADAIIRLRAEYLRAGGRRDALRFRFTSGDAYAYADYLAGRRPLVRGNAVAWISGAPVADTRAGFRAWLDIVFTYAGTISLARELDPLGDPLQAAAGDVLVQAGSPGHAILVAATARRANHPPVALFVQSFMPAQSIHVLRGPLAAAWYPVAADAPVVTPDWRFLPAHWRRFPRV